MCSESDVLESGKLPQHQSVQQAERCALIAACNLAKNKSIKIYTDSQYAYGVAHNIEALWKLSGYITLQGIPVKNGKLIAELRSYSLSETNSNSKMLSTYKAERYGLKRKCFH